METAFAKPTRRSLLDHFSVIKDTRQPCKVMYPLPEVLLLVVCATIAGCDDYDVKPIDLPRLLGKIAALLPAETAT